MSPISLKFEVHQRVKVLFSDRAPEFGVISEIVKDYTNIKYYTIKLNNGESTVTQKQWLRPIPLEAKEDLLFILRSCNHEHFSLTAGDLHTCFDCGSTRRTHEVAWAAPSIWREL